MLHWMAVPGRTYGINRASNLGGIFTNIANGLDYPVGSYTDTVNTTESAGFYNVEVQRSN